jgi:hypothetical protein
MPTKILKENNVQVSYAARVKDFLSNHYKALSADAASVAKDIGQEPQSQCMYAKNAVYR